MADHPCPSQTLGPGDLRRLGARVRRAYDCERATWINSLEINSLALDHSPAVFGSSVTKDRYPGCGRLPAAKSLAKSRYDTTSTPFAASNSRVAGEVKISNSRSRLSRSRVRMPRKSASLYPG